MSGYRRARAGGLTQGEAVFRRRKNDLNRELAETADPLLRLNLAYDYLRSAARAAAGRGYPLTRGRGAMALETATRALISAGDLLLRPGKHSARSRKEG